MSSFDHHSRNCRSRKRPPVGSAFSARPDYVFDTVQTKISIGASPMTAITPAIMRFPIALALPIQHRPAINGAHLTRISRTCQIISRFRFNDRLDASTTIFVDNWHNQPTKKTAEFVSDLKRQHYPDSYAHNFPTVMRTAVILDGKMQC